MIVAGRDPRNVFVQFFSPSGRRREHGREPVERSGFL